jgi:hypothetical protein
VEYNKEKEVVFPKKKRKEKEAVFKAGKAGGVKGRNEGDVWARGGWSLSPPAGLARFGCPAFTSSLSGPQSPWQAKKKKKQNRSLVRIPPGIILAGQWSKPP